MPPPTANPEGWVELTGFPTFGRRTEISAIAYGNGRFVAVGSSQRSGNIRGRVWTSTDGLAWTAQPAGAFAGLTLEAVLHNGTEFYAFSGPTAVWRSADGSSWHKVQLPEAGGELGTFNAFTGGHVTDAAAAGGVMYAAGGDGALDDIVCDCASVWRSSNGSDWLQSTVEPPYEFEDFAVLPGPPALVVGIGQDPYFGQGVRHTADFETWGDFDLEEGSGLLDAVSDGQRIVAVGYAGDLYDEAIALVTDGTTWTVVPIDSAAGSPAEQVAWAGGRFVAVGAVTWWSTDGLAWTRGPNVPYPPPDPIPPEAGDDPFAHRAIGGGTPGVVLAATYDEGLHVWFAPVSAFD